MDVTSFQGQHDTPQPRSDPPVFYEWVIEDDSCSGISLDAVRAKVALAQTLLEAGAGCGYMRPVALRRDGDDWAYARFEIACWATCSNGAVTWQPS
ncbi:hypothetical protein [Actinoallomurus sp. CA-150999]|uniref:hypothetical protein n=1 Tax=Actinoallomurus sp. CA-150999 TaxID=3239887 RepID=UPI003D940668